MLCLKWKLAWSARQSWVLICFDYPTYVTVFCAVTWDAGPVFFLSKVPNQTKLSHLLRDYFDRIRKWHVTKKRHPKVLGLTFFEIFNSGLLWTMQKTSLQQQQQPAAAEMPPWLCHQSLLCCRKKAPFFIIQSMIKRKFSQFSRQTWKEVRLFIIGTVFLF